MKILLCGVAPLTKELGASKVLLELAEGLQQLDWECKLMDASGLKVELGRDAHSSDNYALNLRTYLRLHAAEYDIVDYDHGHLPFPRDEFARGPLFVARSVLLAHHFEKIPIPPGTSLRSRVGTLLKGRMRIAESRLRTRNAHKTIMEADLVNVSCDDDREELLRCGVPGGKIVVVPYGISDARRPLFDEVSSAPPPIPVVAFVGTFDNRKGAREFPKIVQAVLKEMPSARFRFLGTGRSEAEVKAAFGRRLGAQIEVVPRFRPDELPTKLEDCSVGAFPSYIEGFPFGVLEMQAASLPVVAYDAPGPTMMLPPELLVRRGDAEVLSAKIVELLRDRPRLEIERREARTRSQRFSWRNSAEMTNRAYSERIKMRNATARHENYQQRETV